LNCVFIESRVEIVSYMVTALSGYLLGSIPTGFLVAQARGIDIRAVGSGNIGATNVLRALGKPAGVFVLFMDALKGWLAVVPLSQLVLLAFGLSSDAGAREVGAIIAGVSAILGHNFTCWLHFKGGKGIATSAGVLLALVPWALLTILIIWIIVFASTRYVSLGSVAAAAALPFATWATHESITKIVVTGAMSALAIYKHKGNIQRLLNGTEARFGSKSKEEATR
jgi:acyl phosphate:glycerol-3-phosphate acyltransferase